MYTISQMKVVLIFMYKPKGKGGNEVKKMIAGFLILVLSISSIGVLGTSNVYAEENNEVTAEEKQTELIEVEVNEESYIGGVFDEDGNYIPTKPMAIPLVLIPLATTLVNICLTFCDRINQFVANRGRFGGATPFKLWTEYSAYYKARTGRYPTPKRLCTWTYCPTS